MKVLYNVYDNFLNLFIGCQEEWCLIKNFDFTNLLFIKKKERDIWSKRI